jgi:hypothetical protein
MYVDTAKSTIIIGYSKHQAFLILYRYTCDVSSRCIWSPRADARLICELCIVQGDFQIFRKNFNEIKLGGYIEPDHKLVGAVWVASEAQWNVEVKDGSGTIKRHQLTC